MKTRSDGMDDIETTMIVLVLASVLTFSSYSLFQLMQLCGIPIALCWVLSAALDAQAVLATKVWLNGRYPKTVQRYAAGLAIGAFAVSVACAGIQHTEIVGKVVNGEFVAAPPEWLKFAVGALPTAAAAGMVHLFAMIRSWVVEQRDEEQRRIEAQLAAEAERARKTAEREQYKPARQEPPTVKVDKSKPAAPASNVRDMPAPGTPTKKELGIRYVVAQVSGGRSLDAITAADIDRATGSNGYFKKHMDEVRAEARRRRNDTSGRSVVGE